MVVIRPRGSAIVLLDWSVFLLWFVVNCVRERSGEKKREKARQEGGKETHTKKKQEDGWMEEEGKKQRQETRGETGNEKEWSREKDNE